MKTKIWLSAVLAMVLSFSTFALSLPDAKQQGWVGERQDGLLGLVVNNREAAAVVKSINAKRIAHYKKLARDNAISYEQVAKRAGEGWGAVASPSDTRIMCCLLWLFECLAKSPRLLKRP